MVGTAPPGVLSCILDPEAFVEPWPVPTNSGRRREPFTLEAAMTKNLKLWASVLVAWLLVALGLVVMYSAGQIVAGSLVFFEALAVVLAITAVFFLKKTAEPEESLNELLYEGEKTGPAGVSRHQTV
jgi:hypothetical protein